MNLDRSAHEIIRLTAGAVFLLVSVVKLAILDFWQETYIPDFVANAIPSAGPVLVFTTSLVGILVGLFLLFNRYAFEAALVGTVMMVIVEVFLFVMIASDPLAQPALLGDLIRNVALVGLLFATTLIEYRDAYLTIG